MKRWLGLCCGMGIVTSVNKVITGLVNNVTSKFSSQDIHEALFDKPIQLKTLEQLDQGIRKHLKRKHERYKKL